MWDLKRVHFTCYVTKNNISISRRHEIKKLSFRHYKGGGHKSRRFRESEFTSKTEV